MLIIGRNESELCTSGQFLCKPKAALEYKAYEYFLKTYLKKTVPGTGGKFANA